MVKKSSSQSGNEQLTKAVAEQVFGWKSVRKYKGELLGRKQDKAGRWRKGKVPDYSGDQRFAYAIDDRMKELRRWDPYLKELSRITRTKDLPPEWATPEQRCQAALRVSRSRHLRLVLSNNAGSR